MNTSGRSNPPQSGRELGTLESGSLARMRMIRARLAIGFLVTELADIFSERNSGGAPCRVRKLAAEKLAVFEERLRELQS